MAIGSIVFAIIVVTGPATGAAINPARYLGAVFMFKAFGGSVAWSQLPAYLIGEFAGGVLGGLAWAAVGRLREDASYTSLAPSDPVTETVPGGASS
jgi:glycerol uptake facilitator protein